MYRFLERLSDPRPILLDGATGTELNRRGVDTALPLWSAGALLNAPDVLRQIHADYLAAGAEVITANTFRTHRRSLAHASLSHRARELTHLAVQIAREAAALHTPRSTLHVSRVTPRPLIAGSLAPLEDCYSPELVPPQEECEREHAEMARDLAKAGVDLILIETMNTVREAQAAARAARDTGLPFVVSFVCRTDGRLFSGESVAEAARSLERFGPAMLGINCTPVPTIHGPLAELRASTRLPILGYANVGRTDDIQGWTNTGDVSPEQYAERARTWLALGLRLVGGCCGTTPAHIQALCANLPWEDSAVQNDPGAQAALAHLLEDP